MTNTADKTTTTTHGYAATAGDKPLAPFTFERRALRDDDVAIDIKFCGICHSDIHTARNEWGGGTIYPVVPGHEIAGVVTAVGPSVTKFKAGDHVGVGCFVDGLRSSDDELEQYQAGTVFTYSAIDKDGTPAYGGYSERIVVAQNYVLRIPDALPLDAAAPLLCAGITLYSPLKHWKAGSGKKIAIVGMGGLGHVGVKIAHAMGADVTVLSQTLSKEADGKRLGAHHYYATSDPKTFEELAGSFDVIINTVSSVIDWNAYISLLRVDGTMVVLGIPEQPIPMGAFPLVMGRRSVSGSMIGNIKETQEMLDFCAAHGITADIETIAMKDVNAAYERILKSDVRYRFVIDCSTIAG